jgi:hypothetical protein
MNWYKKKFADEAFSEEWLNQKYYDGEDMYNEEQKKEYRAINFLEAEINDTSKVVINILREQTPFNKRILDIFENAIGQSSNASDILGVANATIQKAHNVAEITYPELVTAVNKLEFLVSEHKKKLWNAMGIKE